MISMVAAPAMVMAMDTCPVPLSDDPQVAALQQRAEAYVATLGSWSDVEEFELYRQALRAAMGRPPVPVTNRGFKVLTAKRYHVDGNGYLTLG